MTKNYSEFGSPIVWESSKFYSLKKVGELRHAGHVVSRSKIR